MSKDPKIHEASLVQMIDCKVGVDCTPRLQAASMMSVIDAFDRQIQRPAFLELMLAAFLLHTQMGKLYMLNEVRVNYNGTDDPGQEFAATLLNTQNDVFKLAVDTHTELAKRVALLVQCPTSQDPVH